MGLTLIIDVGAAAVVQGASRSGLLGLVLHSCDLSLAVCDR